MSFGHLFTPISLRHKTLRNRMVFGAHTTNMATDGLPGARHLAYYRERALGGAAMIVVEPMPVHPAAVLTRGNFRACDDAVIAPFRALTQACQDEGAVVIQQLYHVGAHGDADNSWHAAWSPSGGPSYHDTDGSHAMTATEIEETIQAFVAAAQRCQRAGFDGVEVWAAYHCLLDQFWTPFSNRRDDQWGGSLQNRTRFSRQILRRIRAACGDDFIIGLSVADEPNVAIALSRESMAEIIALHDHEQLMDYVTCGSGSYQDFTRIIPSFQAPEKLGVDLAAMLKSATSHTLVTAESHIRTPENANTVLGAGQADLVSLVRGQIADPHLANKARDDRAQDIRGCLSCNQQCWGRRSRDYWISCLINPSVGHEWQWGGDRFTATDTPKSILVIGAGPAGLEAARVAAERGHIVTLAEAAPKLGGQFRLAGLQPRRAQISDLIDWYQRQLDALGVDTRLNSYLEADEVIGLAADELILATGSQPDMTGFQRALPDLPQLPGLQNGNFATAQQVMAREIRPGKRVIVLDEGGNWKGCGTAWKLAEAGHQVTIVTPDGLVGKELQRSATDFTLRQTLARLGVDFITDSGILEWTGNAARIVSFTSGKERMLAADTLVTATTNVAFDALAGDLTARGIPFHAIGDGVAARQAAQAFYEGRRLGREI